MYNRSPIQTGHAHCTICALQKAARLGSGNLRKGISGQLGSIGQAISKLYFVAEVKPCSHRE
jgi:hypothetical protein